MIHQWPCKAVVGENGAFYFYKDPQNRVQRHFLAQKTPESQKRMAQLQKKILEAYPKAQVSKDQFCRAVDLAIDIAEAVEPPLQEEEITGIMKLFASYGFTAKLSSIHVNGWLGDHNKLTACVELLKQEFSLNLKELLPQSAFIGDSPNDAPMFAYFPNSVAVSGFAAFADKVETLPQFITQADEGEGFQEFVEGILQTT